MEVGDGEEIDEDVCGEVCWRGSETDTSAWTTTEIDGLECSVKDSEYNPLLLDPVGYCGRLTEDRVDCNIDMGYGGGCGGGGMDWNREKTYKVVADKSIDRGLVHDHKNCGYGSHPESVQAAVRVEKNLSRVQIWLWCRSHVPAFGRWDCYDDLPFTQCFESATQAGLLRYRYSEDRDLYVAGDLYENDVVTPAVIVVPRRREKRGYGKEKEGEKDGWVVCDYDNELKAPKAVDEDLYKISPDLLRAQPKRV
ncbi:hypothetical protein BUALT_Bualt13G0113100 [Buddleja alternifolia]|uniref:Uncharacterized protein n=1 Tax=Buddleja alternifolia TaxID=168488 RepID=A0AAV6WMC5_9LAMI|nr:hypothetical protein BUALT_Bualt13G0113100 [Buddleja alternifolia]